MMEGCMESGKDATEGGAKYTQNRSYCRRHRNAADSLMAIKKLCFDDKTVSLREMYDALKANWVGYEQLSPDCHQRCSPLRQRYRRG
jgi:formate C-acetyltransferase